MSKLLVPKENPIVSARLRELPVAPDRVLTPSKRTWIDMPLPGTIKAFTDIGRCAYRKRMRSFYVEPDEIHKPVAVIGGSDARHIRKVLRLRPGTRVRVTDGRGQAADACIQAFEGDRVLVEILAPSVTTAPGALEIVVAQAMLKDRKMDGLIRSLTELGITTWIPFFSARSVALPAPKRLQGRQARWARIAREAVKQSGRRRQPHIRTAGALTDIIASAKDFDRKIMFWEEARGLPSEPPDDKHPSGQGRIIVLIGPEGGFTTAEADAARRDGFQLASLGPRILRAETAALAAVTLVQYLYGDWRISIQESRL